MVHTIFDIRQDDYVDFDNNVELSRYALYLGLGYDATAEDVKKAVINILNTDTDYYCEHKCKLLIPDSTGQLKLRFVDYYELINLAEKYGIKDFSVREETDYAEHKRVENCICERLQNAIDRYHRRDVILQEIPRATDVYQSELKSLTKEENEYHCKYIGENLTKDELEYILNQLDPDFDTSNKEDYELCNEIGKHIDLTSSTWENIEDALWSNEWDVVSYYIKRLRQRTSARRYINQQRKRNTSYTQRLAEMLYLQ